MYLGPGAARSHGTARADGSASPPGEIFVWQLALGWLSLMDANGSALLLKRLVYAYVAADVAAAWDADMSACPGADNRMSTTRLVLVIAATNAAVHGYGGPCGTEPGSAHEDQVPIGQVHLMWPTTVEG